MSYSVVLIGTHGHSIITGTKIHCMAMMASNDCVAAFLYNERGVLEEQRTKNHRTVFNEGYATSEQSGFAAGHSNPEWG